MWRKKRTIAKEPWSNFWKGVKELNTEMYDNAWENGILFASPKDIDCSVVAAIVGHRGKVINMVWGTCYPLPMLFEKCSLEELQDYKKQLEENFPENAIKLKTMEERNNGLKENFYYDELEEGNFIARFVDGDGEVHYIGYMVDEEICFFINKNGKIRINNIKYFFVKHWNTKKDKEDVVLDLLNRAFGKEIENKEEKEIIEQSVIENKQSSSSNSEKNTNKIEDNLFDNTFAENKADDESIEDIDIKIKLSEENKNKEEYVLSDKENEETNKELEIENEINSYDDDDYIDDMDDDDFFDDDDF